MMNMILGDKTMLLKRGKVVKNNLLFLTITPTIRKSCLEKKESETLQI
jgi:hypothetical protein